MTFDGFLYVGTCPLDFLIGGDELVSLTEASYKENCRYLPDLKEELLYDTIVVFKNVIPM